MTTIVTRAGKGSPLTHTEVDTNFTNLNTNKLEAGAIALGSAATPSISFTGDTNTGIYSPGADQLAVATNGTGRLFVDANGNVGLGITPVANTFIGGARGSAVPALIELAGNGNTVGATGFVFGQDGSGVGILFQRSNAAMAFSTNGTERLRIDSAGLVGIGTSSPDGTTHVHTASAGTVTANSSADDLVVENNGAGGISILTPDASNGSLFFGSPSDAVGAAARWNYTSGEFLIGSDKAGSVTKLTSGDGTTAVTIDSSQRVGIGTTSVGHKLDLLVGGGADGVNVYNNATGAAYYQLATTSRSYKIEAVGSDLRFYDNTGSAERARIDSSGRLLVGTIASPAHQLQVSTDSAGKPSTNTWTIVSDERIKEEIELADLDLCYEAVKIIPLKRFKWKDEVYTEEQVRDRRKLGWIAQDVEAVFPKAVGTYEFKYNQVFEETIIPAVEEVLDDEGNVTTPAQPERIEKGKLISEDVIEDCRDLNSDQLYAAMYGAIQKLMVKVETLETELAALKTA